MENVQLSLVLQTENKGSVVAGGELNVCLDGMVVDLGSLPNGSMAADSESRLYHTHIHIEVKVMTQKCTEKHLHKHSHEAMCTSVLLSEKTCNSSGECNVL